ncbi:GMC oxidoreductase [Melanomma pulvis-pyrius CBS 109.77]|uniref:GMC oxidoreductase n=1 Tax=Melanomma pulvis-pyrius CBS 109.77 TaxID=1314802 RepID=A0A6A6X5T4_9PLEO|nr:GMC oxidoreductase [Melanomma pulvis-pyrius CBS 109.77]
MLTFSRLATAVRLLSALFVPTLAAVASESYDYVIVGGGISGLVVANRLSEDNRKSVLVIESGDFVDTDGTKIPYLANDLSASAGLIWGGMKTKPEPGLGNATFDVYVAKVLGGGSVINGMVYDRGSAADYDAWEALGNSGWGWKGIKPYFIKGTTFQPPTKEITKEYNITWDPAVYGSGPLSVSITSNQYPDVKDYWKAWKATGVHVPVDGNNGEAYGPSWYGNTMDATTGRRAHARYAYYDPISKRTNLKIMLKTTAQKIIFSDDKKAVARGVTVYSNSTGKFSTIYAKKEVILAAGAVQTPKLLQLSGVGPQSVLKAAGIKVRVALDAVGSNFHDHPYATVIFNTSNASFPTTTSLATNATFNATAWAEYVARKTGPYTYARGNALAFISLPDITSKFSSIVNSLTSQKNSDYLPSIYKNNKPLLKGAAAQRKIIADLFKRKDAAVVEFPVPADGTYGLVGIEKPLSRGTIHINAANPEGPLDIAFNALVNPVDIMVLGAGLRYLRTVWARPELDKFSIVETVPGAQFTKDEDIVAQLNKLGFLSPTLAHPSGSCPMMPEQLGGCVSDKLKVYGTDRLSIVDASIIPIIPSCHLQATMYGVGEKAADIIKARG